MNLLSKLQFGDNKTGLYNMTYLVVKCNFGVKRIYDSYTPNNTITCRDIEVTIVAPEDEDISIFSWYLKNEKRNGRVTFEILDLKHSGETQIRSLQFEDAQCVSIKEKYDIALKKRRQLTLVFTAFRIKIEDNVFASDAKNGSKEDSSSDDDVDMDKYNTEYDF